MARLGCPSVLFDHEAMLDPGFLERGAADLEPLLGVRSPGTHLGLYLEAGEAGIAGRGDHEGEE